MGIPVLREVGYTDDGCTEYQCLQCGYAIEMRNSPIKYLPPDYEEYELIWKYCPVCGCQWESFMPEKQQRARQKYWDDPRARTDRIRPCQFVLEERYFDPDNPPTSDTGPYGSWDREYGPTQYVESVIQALRERQEWMESNKNCFGDHFKYRIRKVDK